MGLSEPYGSVGGYIVLCVRINIRPFTPWMPRLLIYMPACILNGATPEEITRRHTLRRMFTIFFGAYRFTSTPEIELRGFPLMIICFIFSMVLFVIFDLFVID